MKLKSLIEPGDPEQVATGFQFTEGPVWHPDGYLLFSDIPASRIYQWAPGSPAAVWREPSGFSNGLTLDRERRLVACERGIARRRHRHCAKIGIDRREAASADHDAANERVLAGRSDHHVADQFPLVIGSGWLASERDRRGCEERQCRELKRAAAQGDQS